MGDNIPDSCKRGRLDVEDVRHYMFDRAVDDNTLDLDLTFSDDEINQAMRFMAMRFNDLAPRVYTIHPQSLPMGTVYLAGIAYYLYLGWLQKLMRNDIDYTAGNAAVEIEKRRIEHLKILLPIVKDEFETTAISMKREINFLGAYRAY